MGHAGTLLKSTYLVFDGPLTTCLRVLQIDQVL